MKNRSMMSFVPSTQSSVIAAMETLPLSFSFTSRGRMASAGRPVTFPAVAAAKRASPPSFGSSTDTVPLPRLTRKLARAPPGEREEEGSDRSARRRNATRYRPTIDRSRLEKLSANGTNATYLAIAERLRLWPPTLGGRGRRSADIFAAAMARRGVATNASAFVRTPKVKHAGSAQML